MPADDKKERKKHSPGGEINIRRRGKGITMANQSEKLVIESVREDGKRFRPSDWIERISANSATFGRDHRLHYSPSVQPKIIAGEKCLVVSQSLQHQDPDTYSYIVRFARSNGLRCHEE